MFANRKIISSDSIEDLKQKPWLTIKCVALLSGLSDSTIRRCIYRGTLKTTRTTARGKILIKREWFERWLNG
jgi:excisionase family DNA binding protein